MTGKTDRATDERDQVSLVLQAFNKLLEDVAKVNHRTLADGYLAFGTANEELYMRPLEQLAHRYGPNLRAEQDDVISSHCRLVITTNTARYVFEGNNDLDHFLTVWSERAEAFRAFKDRHLDIIIGENSDHGDLKLHTQARAVHPARLHSIPAGPELS